MTTLQDTDQDRHKVRHIQQDMTTLQDRDRHKVMTTLQTYNNRNDNPRTDTTTDTK